ncbi:Type IV pilus biogeneis protein PilE [Candidatus Burkholderia verschuerenii]|uniref:Type IV pilus biogeneis protein PilE n=1 Tax=Candidatus Burkholderia verschuerenii TaxID=242163 RepID=A0A0L0MAE1_9BURK|nr:type IV pilin protein [Candidatus Burkholderia verschuerenii]KND59662.1 Type IV pilus biogeneis protein PilE [Candidatus Burkholderia verschuerenii]
MKRIGQGFSLLELMIALGVAAIIATYAIPAYRAHVAKAHRLDAAAALMRAVQFVETARLTQTAGGESIALPMGLDRAPSNGAANYALTLLPESATNGGYSIEAAPIAFGAMQNDACGTFVIDATGLRANRTSTSAPLEAAQSSSCWAGKG